MRRFSLALLAVAALLLLPRAIGPRRAPAFQPTELRDAVADAQWPDLAEIHQRAAGETPSCGWCHLDSRPGAARAAASDPGRWLAGFSGSAAQSSPVGTALCQSCHDGRVAPAAAHTLPGRRSASLEAGTADHPVDVDYMTSALTNPQQYHHPVAHPEIRLESGRVGCTSCHVGHARNGQVQGPAGLLANACLSCHNL